MIFFTFSQIPHLFLQIHVFSPHIYYFFHLFISFFTTFFMNLLCFSFFHFFSYFFTSSQIYCFFYMLCSPYLEDVDEILLLTTFFFSFYTVFSLGFSPFFSQTIHIFFTIPFVFSWIHHFFTWICCILFRNFVRSHHFFMLFFYFTNSWCSI